MAIKNSWASGEVLTAADLTDTMKGVSINPQTGTSYTFSLTDGFVTLSNASGGTATIPTNATAAFNTGAVIGVMNAGTVGSFVIAPAATVTLNAVSGTTTLAPLESATLVKLGTNTWQLSKGGGLPKATYSATTGSPTVTTVSGKTCVEYTGSGSITISQAGTVEILVVGGGGGAYPGGGGAGGHLYVTNAYLPSGLHTVTVGAGGAGSGAVNGYNGQASLVGPYIAPGGGSGAKDAEIGGDGGSGGGGGSASTPAKAGGSGTSGVGNAGGSGSTGNAAGGGGGAGAVGGNASGSTGGAGGNGLATSITGSSITRAGGGGGYGFTAGGAGGTGGGGAGTAGAGVAGTANTGGGGGGLSAAGGSGIVILLFG